jgi:hypothetical protein
VELTYEYLTNGRLSVVARLKETNREVRLELERTASMSRERVQRWKQVIDKEGGLDSLDALIQQELEEVERNAGKYGIMLDDGPPPDAYAATAEIERPELGEELG